VAGSCEYGNEAAGSGATEIVYFSVLHQQRNVQSQMQYKQK
jgi:hypothetical protein